VSSREVSHQTFTSPPIDRLCQHRRSKTRHPRHVLQSEHGTAQRVFRDCAKAPWNQSFIQRKTNPKSALRRRNAKVDRENQNGTHLCDRFQSGLVIAPLWRRGIVERLLAAGSAVQLQGGEAFVIQTKSGHADRRNRRSQFFQRGAIQDSIITNERVNLCPWSADFIAGRIFLQTGPKSETLNSRNAGTNVQGAEGIGSIRCVTPRTSRLTCIIKGALPVARRSSFFLGSLYPARPAPKQILAGEGPSEKQTLENRSEVQSRFALISQ
jgi:hypothetical protein